MYSACPRYSKIWGIERKACRLLPIIRSYKTLQIISGCILSGLISTDHAQINVHCITLAQNLSGKFSGTSPHPRRLVWSGNNISLQVENCPECGCLNTKTFAFIGSKTVQYECENCDCVYSVKTQTEIKILRRGKQRSPVR